MKNNWNSPVMEEFEKIAKEQGFLSSKLKDDKDVVGNAKEPTPVKDHRRYEPTEEYDVTNNKNIIEEAHPDKKKEIAESHGEGGVVENQIEQQEKDIEAATNMPSGALVGVHANLIQNLVKIANELEDDGNVKAASLIDDAIARIHRPFQDSRMYKKAFWVGLLAGVVVPAAAQWIIGKVTKPTISGGETFDRSVVEKDKVTGKEKITVNKGTTPKVTKTPSIGKAGLIAGAIVTGLSILGLLGNRITSLREGLKIDIQDLYNALRGSKAPSASAAVKKLQPLATLMSTLNLSDEESFKNFVVEFFNFEKKTLPLIELDVLKIADIEDVSLTPYGLSDRIKAKLEDVKNDVKEMNEIIKKAQSVGSVISEKAQEDMQLQNSTEPSTISPGVKGLQEILSSKGFLNQKWNVEVTGELDDNTLFAAHELEQMIGNFSEKEGLAKKESAIGTIIKDNELNPKFVPENLYRLLDMLEIKAKNK